MKTVIKHFNELSTDELFEIYRLRVSVFVVEQSCPYQEVDGYDRASVHIWLEDEDGIEAYLRVLPAGTVFDSVSIGRVIAVKRRQGLGSAVVAEGIKAARACFGAEEIVIEAQTYARGLYEKFGFVQISDEFFEDGIPHIKMKLSGL